MRIHLAWPMLTAGARSAASLLLACNLLVGCRNIRPAIQPRIDVLQVPQAAVGGPDAMGNIGGRVVHAQQGQQIVLNAQSGDWWVQPLANQPFVRIQPDGTSSSSTHLGTRYAVLLVDAVYRPASKLTALPGVGEGIAVLTVVQGRQVPQTAPALVHISGYDWVVRSAGSDRGGEPNAYDPANVWVEGKGYLHLHMGMRNGTWSCAEVSLPRSLGFGTYQFILEDTSYLTPSAVFGIFTWDEVHSQNARDEMDIEMSRWGDPAAQNAQYVTQPFYLPDNLYRFSTPAGVSTHAFQWNANAVSFRSWRGSTSGTAPFAEHSFTDNLPAAGSETIHMDLYEFHHAENPSKNSQEEVVIESFRFTP